MAKLILILMLAFVPVYIIIQAIRYFLGHKSTGGGSPYIGTPTSGSKMYCPKCKKYSEMYCPDCGTGVHLCPEWVIAAWPIWVVLALLIWFFVFESFFS